MFSALKNFLAHWYLRYMLVTELYMVEPWERKVIHSLLALVLVAFGVFNYTIVLHGVAKLADSTGSGEYARCPMPSID